MVDVVAAQRWAGRQHVRACTHTHTHVLVLCIQSNYGIHPTCVGMPGQHSRQQRFNYNAHISNCFHDFGSVAMTPHVGHA